MQIIMNCFPHSNKLTDQDSPSFRFKKEKIAHRNQVLLALKARTLVTFTHDSLDLSGLLLVIRVMYFSLTGSESSLGDDDLEHLTKILYGSAITALNLKGELNH